jgi:hypothetical protein
MLYQEVMEGRMKWLWYASSAISFGAALWLANYILFLAMMSARTYADQPLIEQRYHVALVGLAVCGVAAVICFVKARRVGKE